MINTILFDLDGTLLPMELDEFLNSYFSELANYLKEKIEPKLLVKYVMDATEKVILNKDKIKNETVFMERFNELAGGNIEEYKNLFIDFYNSSFEKAKKSTYVSSEIVESIRILKEKGYTLAIATNPLFPMVANHHRIKWAGVTPNDFKYISSFESNNFCKPNSKYYQEVLDGTSKKAEECLMVGNDVLDDLSASNLGIKTYLIDNHLVNKYNKEINSDYQGSYLDFLEFVKALPIL